MSQIDIADINKADILAALFNVADKSKDEPEGFDPQEFMTTEQAAKILETGQTYFGAFHGRILSISLSDKDILKPGNYDKYNGLHAARIALSVLIPLDD